MPKTTDKKYVSKYKLTIRVDRYETQYRVTLKSDPYPTPQQVQTDFVVDHDIHPFSFVMDEIDIDPKYRGKPEDSDYELHDKMTCWANICPAATGIIETLKMSPKKLQALCPHTSWRWQRARLIKALDLLWT